MKKVFQTIIDKDHGNCMQAIIASLLSDELNNVPNFVESKTGWYDLLKEYLNSKGYKLGKTYYNENFERLTFPKQDCFENISFCVEQKLSREHIKNHDGINGFFYASVLSPNNFKLGEFPIQKHAVICDKKFNIIHDPNKQYINLINYPLAKLIGFNGITQILTFEKI
jgi:hypothetical protein